MLRGEQRNTDASASHLKHKKLTHGESATRCESLLNILLAHIVKLTYIYHKLFQI